jgi:hypothetical protein
MKPITPQFNQILVPKKLLLTSGNDKCSLPTLQVIGKNHFVGGIRYLLAELVAGLDNRLVPLGVCPNRSL